MSVRVPEEVRNRLKAVAAARGERLQDLVGGLVAQFLEETERRPPELAGVLRRLREAEATLRARGVTGLWVFGSVARGDAQPDSDVDLAFDYEPGTRPSLLAVARIAEDLEAVLGRSVDLGERAAMKPGVADAAARDFVRAF